MRPAISSTNPDKNGSTARAGPTSRSSDIRASAGVRSYLSGKCRTSTANRPLTTTWPVSLARAAQAKAALLVDLDEVVEEADQPESGHQAEYQQSRW